MTRKLKKLLIVLTRNQQLVIAITVYYYLFLIAIMFCLFLDKVPIIVKIIIVGNTILAIPLVAIGAIKRQNEEVIYNNKLIDVIFSDKDVIECYSWLLFSILAPVRCNSTIIIILYVVIFNILRVKLKKYITNYFKQRLK